MAWFLSKAGIVILRPYCNELVMPLIHVGTPGALGTSFLFDRGVGRRWIMYEL